MIKVTRLNKEEFFINDDLIEFIESTPNTVISLSTGKKIVVSESVDVVIEKIMEFKRKVFQGIVIKTDTKNWGE